MPFLLIPIGWRESGQGGCRRSKVAFWHPARVEGKNTIGDWVMAQGQRRCEVEWRVKSGVVPLQM